MARAFSSGFSDLSAGLRKRSVWLALASEDITDQHRRTTFGPVWLLLNYLAFALTFIVIFSGREDSVNYPAYVAIGLFVWLYLLEVTTMSISLFVREENFIKGTTLPLSVYVMRLFMQSAIRSGFALVGCLGILVWSSVGFSVSWAYAAAGIVLIIVTTPAAIIVMAMAGAFFPDLQFFVTNVMRLGMFLTPIFWVDGGQGGVRAILSQWNPFAYYLDAVRSPILDQVFPATSFMFCVLMCVFLWIFALYLLGANKSRIAFVL